MSDSRFISFNNPTLAHNLRKRVLSELASNWRLALLGLTGLVLSVASGWTTYDGMTNFTGTPILSLMITFGIQGVMLVTAWLIGESFATGATGEESGRKQSLVSVWDIAKKALQLFVSMAALFIVAYLIAKFILAVDLQHFGQTVAQNAYDILLILGAILGLALFLVLFSRAEIIGPYARGMRVILAHIPLWLMFLSCMATSVFFSFDSLFSSIFPAEERQRAGDLRAQGQIAGIVADLDAQVKQKRDASAKTLFVSEQWTAYETEIGKLITVIRSAPDAIEKQIVAKLKERQTSLAKEQESLSSAKSLQTNLTVEREQLKVSLERLEAEKPKLETEVARIENELRTNRQEVALRKAEAEAEAKGVGDTGKTGRGPIFRELNKAVTKLDIEANAIRSQLKTAKDALDALDRKRARERARMVEIDSELTRLKSQELAAQEGIKIQQTLRQGGTDANVDTSGGLQSLEREITKFRQDPSRQSLINIQQICGTLLKTINEVPDLKPRIGGLDCEPGQANEVAGRVFVQNDNLAKYRAQCGKDAAVPSGGTDELLKFGQDCILVSGLPGAATQSYRLALNRIALNRDDKAHRFVVTWNAFADGNRLAYLAIAIAIAIDGLVFMSGLFGAAVVRSPLSESPHARNRPISHLEEIVDNALLPDKVHAVEQVLNVMHPLHDEEGTGYMARIDLNELDNERMVLIRKVLTAGASLGLIKHDREKENVYFVRSELFEYLSSVRARELRFGDDRRVQDVPRLEIESRPRDEKLLVPDSEPKKLTTLESSSKVSPSHQVQLMLEDNHINLEQFDDAVLNELGLSESELDEFEKNQEELESRLERLTDQGGNIQRQLIDAQVRANEAFGKIYNRMRKSEGFGEEALQLLDERAEQFDKRIPGIVILRAYNKTKQRVENLREQLARLQDKVESADDNVQREIAQYYADMEDAEQSNIENWVELERAIDNLSESLHKI